MVKRRRRSDTSVDGEAASAILGPLPGTPLLELPASLLDDVARRAIQLGAGGNLSLTCRAFCKTNLLHAPALYIKLDDQRCGQLLTPRVVATLQARTCKLALTLEEQQAQSSRQYIRLLTKVLKKLASCATVDACKLGTIKQGPSLSYLHRLGCSPKLAQRLMDSFPSLTSLSLHNYAIPCSGLSSLLSHPQLSLQLQQLDLTGATIAQPKRLGPGAATLSNLFHASRLKQLSLSIKKKAGEDRPLLPNLQPLSQHLTQLCLQQPEGVPWGLAEFTAVLAPLAQLQVLTISQTLDVVRLPELLQALPQLHTLQLPDATVYRQAQLDTLLAATQLISIQLNSLELLSSSSADVPCNWQHLELTGSVKCATAAYLPLHSLTQPLVLGKLEIRNGYDDRALMAAAVHNLTQACYVPVRVKELHLYMSYVHKAVQLQPLVAVLQALKHCSWGRVFMTDMKVGAADVSILAPLCQACTQLDFAYGSVTPSLEFWRQLLELMPTVTHLAFYDSDGSASAAMHESLQLMADQSWARRLKICISRPSGSDRLPRCWRASPLTQPVRVLFK